VRPAGGPLIDLEVQLGRPLTRLSPAWAALCGAVASGRLALSGQAALTMLLTLLLADAAWGFLWKLAAEREWPADNCPSRAEIRLAAPPYTVPGSPSQRAFQRLGEFLAWWRESFWPRHGSALLVALPLTAALAAILGRRMVILTSAALAIVALAFLLRRRGAPPLALQAILGMGLAWLAGHVAFGPLGWPSLSLAALYTGTYRACLALAEGKRPLILLNGSQGAVVALLIALREPMAAGLVGLSLLPQMLLQPYLRRGGMEAWYLRRTQVFLMAGMMAAALAIGY